VCALFGDVGTAVPDDLWEEKSWLGEHRAQLWRILSLGLWSATLIWFYAGDKLILFIKPVYHPFALGAGVVLAVLVAHQVYLLATSHQEHDHGREHGHTAGRTAAVVLILPLIISSLVPSKGLNSYAVGKRDTEIDFSALASQMAADWEEQLAQARQLDQQYPELSLAQALTLASQKGPEAQGTKLTTVGFVYKLQGLPTDIFMQARFKMWCCAADARPMYLPIKYAGAASLEPDQWVKVRGTLGFEVIRGKKAPVLTATDVELIDAPRNQYM